MTYYRGGNMPSVEPVPMPIGGRNNNARSMGSILDSSNRDPSREFIAEANSSSPRFLHRMHKKDPIDDIESGVGSGGDDEEDTDDYSRTSDKDTLLNDIDKLRKDIHLWRKYSGMFTIVEELKRVLHPEKTKNGISSKRIECGDLILILANGIDNGIKDSIGCVQETTFVAALLMTFSVTALISPPESLSSEFLKSDSWIVWVRILGWTMMSAIGGCLILYARMYSYSMSRAVRSSDKLRILLTRDAQYDVIKMLYAMFHCFTWGVLADGIALYGFKKGVIISSLALFTVCFGATLGYRAMKAGHFSYGWMAHQKKRDDPVDEWLLMESLQKKIEYSKKLRMEAKSIFNFPKNDAIFFGAPLGVTDEGLELLNLISSRA